MKENCEVITNIPLIDRTVSKIFANFISEDWGKLSICCRSNLIL